MTLEGVDGKKRRIWKHRGSTGGRALAKWTNRCAKLAQGKA